MGQIDSTIALVGAASCSIAAVKSQPCSTASTNASEAGPSGVAPGAPQDAQMADPPARRPRRKHSDAPVRKLSVSLIDTYKLINQVYYEKRKRRQDEKAAASTSAPGGSKK